jgi:hypothetical protein
LTDGLRRLEFGAGSQILVSESVVSKAGIFRARRWLAP